MTVTQPESTPTDEQLAATIARRGESDQALRLARIACEQLYARYAQSLLAYLAARIRPGERDDLHQDVWKRVWHHLLTDFRGGNFRAWLFQIARNLVIDHGRKYRKRRLKATGEEETLPSPDPEPPENRLIEHERMEALTRCLERLTSEAAALVRARLGGENYSEICLRLRMKPERAYSLFHQAKEQLRTCVERALS